MKRKVISAVLVSAVLILFTAGAAAKNGFEVSADFSGIQNDEYSEEFIVSYLNIIFPSGDFQYKLEYENYLTNVSAAYRHFLSEDIAVKILGSYYMADMESTAVINGIDTMETFIHSGNAYIGIGAEYDLKLLLGVSLNIAADAGPVFQTAFRYRMKTLDSSDAKAELAALSISDDERTGGTGTEFSSVDFIGSVRVGAKYTINSILGISVYGGYRYGFIPVVYPDEEPFKMKSIDGNDLFTKNRINISGPFAGAGLNVDFKEKPKEIEDNKGIVRIIADNSPEKAELQKFTVNKKAKSFFKDEKIKSVKLQKSKLYNIEYTGVSVFNYKPVYEMWTPVSNLGTYNGEFQDRPQHRKEVTMNSTYAPFDRIFNFHGIKSQQGKIAVQVSYYPFTASENVIGSGNVVYEKEVSLPVAKSSLPSGFLYDTFPVSVVVPFGEFVPAPDTMKEKEYYRYYVRGMYFSPQGEIEFTDTVLIKYGFGDGELKWAGPPAPTYKYVPRSLPSVKMKKYVPVQWESPDRFHHYYVFREPKADEIKCKWKNTNTGEILYPYTFGPYQTYYASQGIMNKQQYESIVIPRVLQKGTKVYFPPPKEEDKEWYKQLYDGIVEFFEDLASISKELVNSVSASYNNLKAGMVNYIVKLCPVDSLKGPFKTALEGMVNYGLVVVGVPPTLPNFDDLSNMSLDYMAATALTQAGVPANEITEELVKEIAKELGEQIQQSANRAAPNPVDAAFLKMDPDYLYRPAYVDIEFSNDSDYDSIPGEFNLHVNFEFDYWTMTASNNDPAGGITFNYPNPYVVGSDAATTVSVAKQNHFLYGLNGNTVDFKSGDKAIYDVFSPKEDQTVPILRPHEKRSVRIYIEPYSMYGSRVLERYPTGEYMSRDDFEVMYFGNGNKKFINFYLSGVFPSAEDFLKSQGILNAEPNTEYLYKKTGAISDYAKEKPVLYGWTR